MPATLIFLLVVSIIGSAQSQTWAGTYTADPSCNKAGCCCFSGQVVVIKTPPNTYALDSKVAGSCFTLTSLSGSTTLTGYTGSLTISGVPIYLQLSSDSRNITATTPFSSTCIAQANKV
ncbi:unnamed protein product [Rotaria magnacalcarata]|uniref:Uncharacterized protein n=2 Tax=Rotaria magnacalcarata TaxID=392030 RepID=A0A816NCV6_9BILA|nr:unnamed protein product [Rotaria magnacalcarata]CAF2033813.1 unnamed protein product [Rotaria magnacalcarata]CAF2083085.1 unnamed protein product [Rotaria magnacalcarata]CAF2103577.1 unnamed protein product [Rotaria magnacalcarata]CAF3864635.1 unnamed protein product [Rotaria magnacalcarata]